jgi:hypothetical protein
MFNRIIMEGPQCCFLKIPGNNYLNDDIVMISTAHPNVNAITNQVL